MRADSTAGKRYCANLLEKLVDTPSVFGNEEEIMLFLEREFATLGLKPKRIDVEPGRFNLLCSMGSGSSHVCLNAHSDTVPPSGESQPRSRVNGDVLYGLGAADDKASLAAAVTAYLDIASHIDEIGGTVDLLVSVDEEGDASGVRTALRKGYTCDYAIVGEPTGLDIVHVHCGLLFLELTTRGKSAHGSTPSNGINAVDRMLELVERISDAVTGFQAHQLIGPPTLNLGEIHAGDRPNRVPEECRARIDIRIIPPVSVEEVLSAVKTVVDSTEWAGYRIEKQGEPLDTPVESRLVKSAQEAAASLDTGSSLVGWRGWTEAEPFRTHLGIESIVIGPGDLKQAHSSNEFASISQTQLAASFYVNIVEYLCSAQQGATTK